MTDVLEELAIRCETEEASWQLDVAICRAIGCGESVWWTREVQWAVGLWPSGWMLLSASDMGPIARVVLRNPLTLEEKRGGGATLAGAWCAAALRARAAMALAAQKRSA